MTHREALERLFAAWSDGDAPRSVALFAPAAVYREARHDPLTGREAILSHFTKFFRDGPRFEFEAQEIIVEGDRAAVLFLFTTISGIGTRAEREGCALVAFHDGTITEWREYGG
jgi:uncharacterized protein (TIGR02246 family)